jgi:hypothetical protein
MGDEADANDVYMNYAMGAGGSNTSVACPKWAPILGFTGITCAVIFASTSLLTCFFVNVVTVDSVYCGTILHRFHV